MHQTGNSAGGRGPVLALVLSCMAGAAGAADEWTACPENGWYATGGDAEERLLVCRGVAAAAGVLAGCGLDVKQAGRVRLVDELPVFCDSAAYGLFDAQAAEIRLGRPGLCVATAPTGSAFLSLPVEAAFMALASHEAAHALIFALGLGAERRLEHEYIAGVVQHSVLDPEQRDLALDAVGALPPDSEAEFNAFLLFMAPERYSAKAWLHFESRSDGCVFLRGLVSGAVRLPDLPNL